MSSGRVHNTFTGLVAAGLVATAPWWAYKTGATGLWMIPGAMAAILVNPDLDVDRGNQSHSLVEDFAGRPFALFWRIYWWPYAKALPHRHFLSHGPVVSTAIRVGYVALSLLPLWFSFPELLPAIVLHPAFWFAFAGLTVADIAHWAMDIFS